MIAIKSTKEMDLEEILILLADKCHEGLKLTIDGYGRAETYISICSASAHGKSPREAALKLLAEVGLSAC